MHRLSGASIYDVEVDEVEKGAPSEHSFTPVLGKSVEVLKDLAYPFLGPWCGVVLGGRPNHVTPQAELVSLTLRGAIIAPEIATVTRQALDFGPLGFIHDYSSNVHLAVTGKRYNKC